MWKQIFLAIFITVSYSVTKAQDTIRLAKAYLNPKSERFKVVTDRPPQAAFAELGGAALLFSINYDRRFSNRTDGFGFRAGIGGLLDDIGFGSMMVFGVNHLVGNNKKGRFFESGINYSLLTHRDYDFDNGFISLTMGYRSQPVQGGFCFRAGINPIYVPRDRFFVPWPYLSVGYNF